LVLATQFAACGPGGAAGEDHSERAAVAPTTNRVDIPPNVRANLGITLAAVERRRVASTIRVPGRFELLPSARREHRPPMNGRVDLAVTQYQPVARGDVLYRLDSPTWRALQRELAETSAAVDVAQARQRSLEPIMEAHRLHEQGLREAVDLWTARVEQLSALGATGGGRAAELAEAQARLTEARASFGEVREKDAELQLRRAETESELRSAAARLSLLEPTAAVVLGLPPDWSASTPVPAATASSSPFWLDVAQIEVRAAMNGIVEQVALTNGAWAEEGELVLSVVDPSRLRFRAVGLQSDLGRLRAGLETAIVPPRGGGFEANASIAAQLQIGLDADPVQRTIELLAIPSRTEAWTRPGVSAFLEIATDGTASPELAIPLAAVVRDGLATVIFRRDPANPDRAIRLAADLGIDDGRWVVIHSGVREGDEVVVNGVYQLMLATSATAAQGGHFHADGTFHAGEDE
jgi:multidrug resistance efflux pump